MGKKHGHSTHVTFARLTKADLGFLGEEKLVLLASALTARNELGILLTSAVCAQPEPIAQDAIVSEARASQTLFFLQLLAGKLNEAWVLFDTNYMGKQLLADLESKFAEEGKKALREVENHFRAGSSPIRMIRQKFAFHYDIGFTRTSLHDMDSSSPIQFWLTKHPWTTRYDIGSSIAYKALDRVFSSESACRPSDPAQGIVDAIARSAGEEAAVPGKVYGVKRFLDEVIAITEAFLRFLDAVICALIGNSLKKVQAEIDVSRASDPGLPAFPRTVGPASCP